MMPEDYVYKTRPAWFFLSFMLAGAFFFGFILHLAWSSKGGVSGTDAKTGHAIIIVLYSCLGLFLLGCLAMVIGFKICYLTKHELIVTRPLFFFKRTVLLMDMQSFAEGDVKIDTSRSLTPNPTTIGTKTTIKLKSGKQIILSSLDIGGYDILMKKIHTQIRTGK